MVAFSHKRGEPSKSLPKRMKTGIELIAAERKRQIEVEGWTPEHDDGHSSGELAMAAACYATTSLIYRRDDYANQMRFLDPWPWDDVYDRRYRMGSAKKNPGNVLPDPATYTDEETIDLLVKAGALIAAEIDRLQRAAQSA